MKNKINILTIITICFTILFLSVAFCVLPDVVISEKENRALTQLPPFSVKQLISGQYTANLTNYISDQFPARDIFVATKAYCELLQGKKENNNVIAAKQNTLIPYNKQTLNHMQENLESVKAFQTDTNTSLWLALLPRTIDVYSERLPAAYPKEKEILLWNNFFDGANNLKLNTPNLQKPLCEQNNYYRTDHHYNTYGAYQTYALLGKELGFVPKEKDFFDIQNVTDQFCGTAMRSSGFYLTPKDTIKLFRYDSDNSYSITADGKKISLYDFSALDKTDKYAVFLGGNHARVDIIGGGKQREKLLIIRDSFADSIAPFLALHYDLTLIDLRYYNNSVQQLVSEEKIKNVLILQSIEEFSQAKNISYLRMGVK